MAKKSPFSQVDYAAKLAALKNYTDIKIKSKKKFTPAEKGQITKQLKILLKQGVVHFDERRKEFTPAVKFVKNKKKPEKIKGVPKMVGYFIRGASPREKVTANGIIKGQFFDKILIPVDFSGAEIIENDDPESFHSELYDFVYQELFSQIMPYWLDLNISDYFTIVTMNGWEMGRGRTKNKEKKKGRIIARQAGKKKKLEILTETITEILIRAAAKYQVGFSVISALYLYKFKNQRKPNKTEKKILKRKKKK